MSEEQPDQTAGVWKEQPDQTPELVVLYLQLTGSVGYIVQREWLYVLTQESGVFPSAREAADAPDNVVAAQNELTIRWGEGELQEFSLPMLRRVRSQLRQSHVSRPEVLRDGRRRLYINTSSAAVKLAPTERSDDPTDASGEPDAVSSLYETVSPAAIRAAVVEARAYYRQRTRGTMQVCVQARRHAVLDIFVTEDHGNVGSFVHRRMTEQGVDCCRTTVFNDMRDVRLQLLTALFGRHLSGEQLAILAADTAHSEILHAAVRRAHRESGETDSDEATARDVPVTGRVAQWRANWPAECRKVWEDVADQLCDRPSHRTPGIIAALAAMAKHLKAR